VLTARYELIPYIKQIRFRLLKTKSPVFIKDTQRVYCEVGNSDLSQIQTKPVFYGFEKGHIVHGVARVYT